ncbi:hypothetical protein PYCC9005_005933 [Savitreella phatthalungensis]
MTNEIMSIRQEVHDYADPNGTAVDSSVSEQGTNRTSGTTSSEHHDVGAGSTRNPEIHLSEVDIATEGTEGSTGICVPARTSTLSIPLNSDPTRGEAPCPSEQLKVLRKLNFPELVQLARSEDGMFAKNCSLGLIAGEYQSTANHSQRLAIVLHNQCTIQGGQSAQGRLSLTYFEVYDPAKYPWQKFEDLQDFSPLENQLTRGGTLAASVGVSHEASANVIFERNVSATRTQIQSATFNVTRVVVAPKLCRTTLYVRLPTCLMVAGMNIIDVPPRARVALGPSLWAFRQGALQFEGLPTPRQLEVHFQTYRQSWLPWWTLIRTVHVPSDNIDEAVCISPDYLR